VRSNRHVTRDSGQTISAPEDLLKLQSCYLTWESRHDACHLPRSQVGTICSCSTAFDAPIVLAQTADWLAINKRYLVMSRCRHARAHTYLDWGWSPHTHYYGAQLTSGDSSSKRRVWVDRVAWLDGWMGGWVDGWMGWMGWICWIYCTCCDGITLLLVGG
jgi:hypothetical protein